MDRRVMYLLIIMLALLGGVSVVWGLTGDDGALPLVMGGLFIVAAVYGAIKFSRCQYCKQRLTIKQIFLGRECPGCHKPL